VECRTGLTNSLQNAASSFTLVVEREGMHTQRHVGAGLAAAILGLALFAGCGGSSTRATPLPTVPTTTSPAAASASGAAGASDVTRSTTTSPTTATPGASAPTASQLAAVQSDLAAAGSSLDASDSAIGAADVNRAEAQEGSAP
jgi:hypothetical protein